MVQLLPKALLAVIDELGRLPGVGVRTAERYAYYLLRSNTRNADELAKAIAELHSGVKTCPVTFALIDAGENISPLYAGLAVIKSLLLLLKSLLILLLLSALANTTAHTMYLAEPSHQSMALGQNNYMCQNY